MQTPQMEHTRFTPQRFKAMFRGQTLGWYDTLDEAQAAVNRAAQEEREEI